MKEETKKHLILYVVSDIDRAVAFEWIAKDSLSWPSFRVAFVFIGSKECNSAKKIREIGLEVYILTNTKKTDSIGSLLQLARLFYRLKPAIVHCHLLKATLIGLTAAIPFRRIKTVYTRHHSNLHHIYFPKGIIWDLYSNHLANKVISISPSVSEILRREGLNRDKIIDIPHGFDLAMFDKIPNDRVLSFKRRHEIPENSKIIGVISRFVEWKGIKFIIEAFRQLRCDYQDIHLVLLNAIGPEQIEIEKSLEILQTGSWTSIPYENDIAAAFSSMTCFVHAPIDGESEAFGQVYVEALATGVPSIFTLSGIAPSFVKHNDNALVIPYRNSKAIESALRRLLTNTHLRQKLATNGRLSVSNTFTLEAMIHSLLNLYADLTLRSSQSRLHANPPKNLDS